MHPLLRLVLTWGKFEKRQLLSFSTPSLALLATPSNDRGPGVHLARTSPRQPSARRGLGAGERDPEGTGLIPRRIGDRSPASQARSPGSRLAAAGQGEVVPGLSTESGCEPGSFLPCPGVGPRAGSGPASRRRHPDLCRL